MIITPRRRLSSNAIKATRSATSTGTLSLSRIVTVAGGEVEDFGIATTFAPRGVVLTVDEPMLPWFLLVVLYAHDRSGDNCGRNTLNAPSVARRVIAHEEVKGLLHRAAIIDIHAQVMAPPLHAKAPDRFSEAPTPFALVNRLLGFVPCRSVRHH